MKSRGEVDGEAISSIKTALMGPLSGIGGLCICRLSAGDCCWYWYFTGTERKYVWTDRVFSDV